MVTTTASVLTRPRDVSRPVNVPTSALGYRSLTTTPAVPALLGLSAAALAAAFFAIVYLHSVSVAELSPMSTTVSDLVFVHGIGWLFTVSTALLGIASVALTVALARTRLPGGRLITVVLGLWSLGLIVAAAFPTDPIGVEHLSAVGQIHRYAGATMYVALPVAGWLVLLRSRAVASWDYSRRAVRNLSLAAAVIGVLFLLSSAPSLFPGTPLADLLEGHLVHGLVERVLILCLFGLLLAIGVGVARAGHETASREGAPA